jgi:Zn-dependent M28 family amino/carboxypeptidase
MRSAVTLFLATTGEEFGIVGSPYFVEHPTVPLEAIVAAINIDGPSLLTDPTNAVLAMGAATQALAL